MGSGKGLAIIALIIGVSGLGFGVFSFINNQTGVPIPSGSIVVGIWESLSRNTDNPSYPTDNDWLIEVGDKQLENNQYISLNQSTQHSNTRFHLKREGWYRANLHMLLSGVSSAAGWYQMYLLKNGTLYSVLLYEASINQHLQIDLQFYIDSDGNDYFEINCYASGDASFSIESQQIYNQLALEYFGGS
jgi:hypothetical protein